MLKFHSGLATTPRQANFALAVLSKAFMVRDMLGHKTLAMTDRYVNRARDPAKALSDRVAGEISAAMVGKPKAEVVPLRTGSKAKD